MNDRDKLTREILVSARQFAKFGLNIASTAVGYAAEVLRDVEKELKDSSERFTKEEARPGEPAAGQAASPGDQAPPK